MLLLPFAIQQALNHLDIEQGWMQAQHVNMESAGGAAALEFVRDGGVGAVKDNGLLLPKISTSYQIIANQVQFKASRVLGEAFLLTCLTFMILIFKYI